MCNRCDKRFRVKVNLTRHILRFHEGKRFHPCKIEGCEKSFFQKCELVAHLLNHTGAKPFSCHLNHCGRGFVRKSHLNRHMLIHTRDKGDRFHCEVDGCEKTYSRKEHLNGHIGTHTGEKPVSCQLSLFFAESCKRRC